MLDTKTWAIRFGISLSLYVAAAWGWQALTGGDGVVFWTALAWLIGIRLWFSLVDAISSWTARLMHPKATVTNKIAAHAREYRYPLHAAPLFAASHPSVAPSVRASVRRRNRGLARGRAKLAIAHRATR
jgi:hypothetical protein